MLYVGIVYVFFIYKYVDVNDGVPPIICTRLLNATTWNLLAKNTCGTCHARDIWFFLFRGGWGNIRTKFKSSLGCSYFRGMRVSSRHPLPTTRLQPNPPDLRRFRRRFVYRASTAISGPKSPCSSSAVSIG